MKEKEAFNFQITPQLTTNITNSIHIQIEMSGSDTGKVVIVIGIILFMVPFFVIPLAMASGDVFSLSPAIFVFSALGMALMIIGSALASEGGFLHYSHSGQRIPPVNYPSKINMPEDEDIVEEVTCPNCGASPKFFDSHGLCMCEYCQTKFKVR